MSYNYHLPIIGNNNNNNIQPPPLFVPPFFPAAGPMPLPNLGMAPFGDMGRPTINENSKWKAITLYVGNIPEQISENSLVQILTSLGNLGKWVRTKGNSGELKNFGFAEYMDELSAIKAKDILNNYNIFGKTILVKANEKNEQLLSEFKESEPYTRYLAGKEMDYTRIQTIVRQILSLIAPPHEPIDDSPQRRLQSRNDVNQPSTNSININNMGDNQGLGNNTHTKLSSTVHGQIHSFWRDIDKISDLQKRELDMELARNNEDLIKTSDQRKSRANADLKARLREVFDYDANKYDRYVHETDRNKEYLDYLASDSIKILDFMQHYDDDRDDSKYYNATILSRKLVERNYERERDVIEYKKDLMHNEDEDKKPVLIKSTISIRANTGTTDTNKEIIQTSFTTNTLATLKPVEANNINTDTLIDFGVRFDAAGYSEKGVGGPQIEEIRKKYIKRVIEKLPTSLDELFVYPLQWELLSDTILSTTITQYINKKMTEYMGSTEGSLTEFIIDHIKKKTPPAQILTDVSQVLDEEATTFMQKLWRLLIYETQCVSLGIN